MIPVGDSLCDSQINTQCAACPDNKQEKTFKWSEKEQREEMGGWEESGWEGAYMQLLFRQTQNQALLSARGKYVQPLMGKLLGKCILLSEEASFPTPSLTLDKPWI